MLWYEAWTLYKHWERICENLQQDINNVADHLHAKKVLQGGLEYGSITDPLRNFNSNYGKATYLLQMLANRTDKEHDNDFTVFCHVLKNELNLGNLVTELTAYASAVRSECSISNRETYRTEVEAWIEKGVRVLHTHNIDDCLKRFRKHVKLRCGNIRKQTALSGVRTGRTGMQDVRQFFTSIQAMELEEVRNANEGGSLACVLSRSDGRPGAETIPIQDPVQILRQAREPYNLVDSSLLISDPGSGKTTICQMLLAEYDDDKSFLSKQYHFPVYIPCRNVNRLCSKDWKIVLGLDDENLHFRRTEQEEILKYLRHNSERLLLIIDGLDEAGGRDPFEDSALSQLIHHTRTAFLGACVLLTSRPCSLASKASRFSEVRYTLAGFSEAQLSQFFKQNLGNEKGRLCMDEMQHPSLKHMKETAMAAPLFATMICEVFRSTRAIPLCNSDLFTEFITTLRDLKPLPLEQPVQPEETNVPVDHQADGEYNGATVASYSNTTSSNPSAADAKCSPRSDTAPRFEDHVSELGQIALRSLRARVYEIPAGDLSEECRCSAINFGVLTKVHTEDRLSFLHVTFQEYYAARRIAVSSDPVAEVESLAKDILVTPETWPVWLFVCGMVPTARLPEVIAVLQRLGSNHRLNASVHIRSLLMCLLEGWHHSRDRHVNFDRACAEVTSPMQLQRNEANKDFSRAAQGVTESDLDLSKAEISGLHLIALELLAVLHPNLEKFRFSGCNLKDAVLSSKALCRVKHLDFSGNKLSGLSLSLLSETLKDAVVDRLVLTSCGLQPDDASHLSNCMGLEHLQYLELTDNCQLGNAFIEKLVNYFPQTGLTTLFLVNIGLSEGCGENLAELVESMTHLSVLSLRQNHLITDDVKLLLPALAMRPMQEILLNANSLTDDVADPICSFFRSLRATKHGSLTSLNDYADAGTASNSSGIPATGRCEVHVEGNAKLTEECMRQIESGGLCDSDRVFFDSHYVCGDMRTERDWPAELESSKGKMAGKGIGDQGMERLTSALNANTELQRIDFGSCGLRCPGAKLFASTLRRNSSLKVVSFARNSISTEGFKDLLAGCESQNGRTGLQALVLSRNATLWRDTNRESLFRTAGRKLARCSFLRCLILSETGMVDEVAKTLFMALKTNQNLRLLVLANNLLTDSSAKALVELKSNNTALLEVSLSRNRITDVGIKALLESAGVRKMLSIWLSGNDGCTAEKFSRPLRDATYLYTPDTLLSDMNDLYS